VEVRLVEIMKDAGAQHHVETIEVEIMPEYVHLFVEIPPSLALSKFVGLIKGRSSRLARSQFARLRRTPSLWTPSWFVSTVGGAPLEVVRRYVENQKLAV